MMYYYIIAQPLIDISTAFTVNLPITVGAFIRTMLMLLLLAFMVKQFYQNDKRTLFYLTIAIGTITLTFIINFFLKEPFYLFDEIQFYLKTMYFIVIIFSVLFVLKTRIFSNKVLRATVWASMILGVSYWLAILTNTDIKSYAYDKLGYSGWYFSANELSVIVIILFSLVLSQLHKERSYLTLFSFLLLLSMTPMIGTKTAFYGGFILLVSYTGYLLVKERRQSTTVVIALIAVIYIVNLPMTPIYANESYERFFERQTNLAEKTDYEQTVLSSRDVYLEETKEDYKNASWIRKLFGLGYAGDYKTSPKTIEMDFYDLFFSYGIIGTIIMLIPIVKVLEQIWKIHFSFHYVLLFFSLLLCTGVSFVAGHVMFAPSVMTYFAILLIAVHIASEEGVPNQL